MTIDSTELTFVRCPSCRSLVPAVSTRCRMCGAGLEVSGSTSEAASSKGSASEKSTDTVVTDPVEEQPVSANQSQGAEEDFEDPLSAYIDEVDVQGEANEDAGDDILSDDEFDKLLDSILSEEEDGEDDTLAAASEDEEEEELEPEVYANGSVEDDIVEDPLEAFMEEEEVAISEKPVAQKVAEPKVEAKKPATDQSNVIIESGRRKPGQKSNLSFANAQVEEETPFDAPQKPAPKKQKAVVESEELVASTVDEDLEAFADEVPEAVVAPVAVKNVKPAEKIEKAVEPRETVQKPAIKEIEVKSDTVLRMEHPAEDNEGRLFGWLVSYATARGEAVELREGKFFVSGKRIKATDLILDSTSISSPHAMITVSGSQGFKIQDLMSEQGVFIRKVGSKAYEQVEDVTMAQNGDWLKFGDLEFLVSLIPG